MIEVSKEVLQQNVETAVVHDIKTVSIIGAVEKGDIAYFLAQYITEAGKKVLIVDNSYRQDVYDSIPEVLKTQDDKKSTETENVEEPNELRFVSGIAFANKSFYNPKFLDFYDIVIYYQGMNADINISTAADMHIFVTDNSKPSYEILAGIYDKIKDVVAYNAIINLVFRDCCRYKIKTKDAIPMMGFDSEKVSESYLLGVSEADISAYVRFTHEGFAVIKDMGLSDEMLYMVSAMAEQITGIETKSMAKINARVQKHK